MKLPKKLLDTSITLAAFKGSGAYGPVYETAATVNVNAQATQKKVVTADGTEVVASAEMLFPADVSPAANSRVIWAGLNYLVIESRPVRIAGRVHHNEVTLQSVK